MPAVRPRALFVAPMLPARGGNGLAMRLGVFLEALTAFADVDLAVIPVAGGPTGRTPFLDAFGARLTVHQFPQETGTHFGLLSRIAEPAARLDAFRHYGGPSLASGLSRPILEQIAQLAARNRHDLVHVARSYMIPAIAGLDARAPLTVDLDEDDRCSFFSRAAFARRSGDALGAEWLEQEGRACDALIAANAHRFRRMFAAGRRDCLALMRRHPGAAVDPVPNAIDVPHPTRRLDDGRTAVFVGSFGYPPNVDGLLWFAERVMPGLEARAGRVRLLVAGANPPAAVRALGRRPNVRILGWVGDLGAVYRRATLAIAPMRGGGGTRIKILEAASFGTAVVADRDSSAALFGPDRPWGWIASHAQGFIAAGAEALRDSAERERRGQFGYNAVVKSHARPAVVARLAQTLREACDPGSQPRG
jgi:polysaccharide biosynthesis protein PslH